MKKLAALAVCSLSLGVLSLAASAKTTTKTTVKKTANVTCPSCKKMGMAMPMTANKTRINTRTVKVNGKSMYCCQQCKMKTMNTKKIAAKKTVTKKTVTKKS